MKAAADCTLTVSELRQLDVFLRAAQRTFPNIEMLDGYLTALELCLKETSDLEVVRVVLTSRCALDHPTLNSPQVAAEFLELLLRHRAMLRSTIGKRKTYLTVLHELPPHKAAVRAWCKGFVKALNERKDHWQSILQQDEAAKWLAPICRRGNGSASWLSEISKMPPTTSGVSDERLQIILCVNQLAMELSASSAHTRDQVNVVAGVSPKPAAGSSWPFSDKPSRLN